MPWRLELESDRESKGRDGEQEDEDEDEGGVIARPVALGGLVHLGHAVDALRVDAEGEHLEEGALNVHAAELHDAPQVVHPEARGGGGLRGGGEAVAPRGMLVRGE